MSTNTDQQGQTVPKIAITPDELAYSIKCSGYDLKAFLNICGVKYNTFQCWKRIGRIPNKSVLILANYLILDPTQYKNFQHIESIVKTGYV